MMAKYRITAPDGGTYEVTAPDDATQEQVLAYAKANYKAPQKAEPAYDPTEGMSGMQKFNAGVGKAMVDLARGVQGRIGLRSREQVAEDRRLDAALMKTGAGMAGNVMGNLTMLAPAALIPGANTVAGAATIGGLVGALQPSASMGEDVANVGLGAVGGAAGQWLANKAAGTVATQQGQEAKRLAQGQQKLQAAQNASKAGYVIPPEDIGGGTGTKLLSGLGGKLKTAQEASQKNQAVTDRLARQALGLSEDAPLNMQTLESVRRAAGDAYDVVKGSGTVAADQAYVKALDDIAQKFTTTSRAFPGAVKSEVPDLVASLKQPNFPADAAVDMTKILRAKADQAFAANDKTAGKAFREASDALEGVLERHLQTSGMPDALKSFQDARSLIAKTYSVQKALNPSTGNVSAPVLAKQLDKLKPLSGELRTIAETGQAFGKATQALKESPKALSPLDFAVAMTTGAATQNPLALALLGARPAARSIMLSSPMQKAALNAAGQPIPANALTRLLSNEELTIPLGMAAGNALSRQYSQ